RRPDTSPQPRSPPRQRDMKETQSSAAWTRIVALPIHNGIKREDVIERHIERLFERIQAGQIPNSEHPENKHSPFSPPGSLRSLSPTVGRLRDRRPVLCDIGPSGENRRYLG